MLAACALAVVVATGMYASRGQGAQTTSSQAPPEDGKLRIIIFGAHPDDAEYRGAGVAMKWARMGHHVKLVSATNGDIGHWQMAGGPLALRRKKEVWRWIDAWAPRPRSSISMTARSCPLSKTGG